MAKEKNVKYFFENEQVLNRMFILYDTADCYRTACHSWLSFDRMLESHLKFMGYQVVVFFRGGDVLECYDEEMDAVREKYFPTRTSSAAEERREAKKNRTISAVPGLDLEEVGAPAEPAEEETTGKEKKRLGARIDIREPDIPKYLNQIMNCSEIKCAVVFTNCWDIFDSTSQQADNVNRQIANLMRSWYCLPTDNNNIGILLFDEPRLSTLGNFLRDKGSWAFLYERMFKGSKHTDAVIRIGGPHADEIYYQLLSYFKSNITEELEQAALALICENGGKLMALRKFLEEREEKEREETAKELIESYGAGSKEDALAKIKSEGWNEVYEMLVRLIGELDGISKPVVGYDMENLTNLRMAYPMKTVQHRINMSIMLRGNPGTGKTTVSEWIGKALYQHGLLPVGRLVKVAKQDLQAGYVGQSELQTQDKINEAIGSVLFVDEAYSLFEDNKEGHSGSFGKQIIDVFVDQMTSRQGEMAFIFAGYPEPMDHFMTANPGLKRRFGENIVTMPDYEPAELERIALKSIADNNPKGASATREELKTEHRIRYVLDDELVYPEEVPHARKPVPPTEAIEILRKAREEEKQLGLISYYFNNLYADRDRTSFGNAGEILQLATTVCNNARKRTGVRSGQIEITQEDFPNPHLFICRTPSLEEIDRQMEKVVGMEAVKKTLKRITAVLQLTTVQNQSIARNHHAEAQKVAPGHYLFIGNPGTGKTMIAEKLAQTLSCLGIIARYQPRRVTGLELTNMIQGVNGVDKVKQFIKDCEGGVLAIDEAHQLAETNLGPIAVKALLDPMISMRDTTCFVFCCYPDNPDGPRNEQYLTNFLSLEPGLERRINDIMYFEDYTPDEILQILQFKAEKEGYRISEECRQLIRAYFEELKAAGLSQNGGSAEKMLREIRVALGSRLRKKYPDVRKMEAAVREEGDGMLYTILPDDVAEAIGRLRESDRVRAKGRALHERKTWNHAGASDAPGYNDTGAL